MITRGKKIIVNQNVGGFAGEIAQALHACLVRLCGGVLLWIPQQIPPPVLIVGGGNVPVLGESTGTLQYSRSASLLGCVEIEYGPASPGQTLSFGA